MDDDIYEVERCFVCHFGVGPREPQIDTVRGIAHDSCLPEEDDDEVNE